MFNVGGTEFMIIALVALIVLGPERMPEVVRKVGRLVAELRRMSNGFQTEFRDAFQEPINAVNEVRNTMQATANDLRSTINSAVNIPAGVEPTGPITPADAHFPSAQIMSPEERAQLAGVDSISEVAALDTALATPEPAPSSPFDGKPSSASAPAVPTLPAEDVVGAPENSEGEPHPESEAHRVTEPDPEVVPPVSS